jgi:hypothetical protein
MCAASGGFGTEGMRELSPESVSRAKPGRLRRESSVTRSRSSRVNRRPETR